MSDKTKRAINKGRRNAGLKPIKFKTKISRKAQLGMGMRAYQNAEKSSVEKISLGKLGDLKKAYAVNGKTRWQIAKKKFKGDKLGLLQYYYNIPHHLLKVYGAPNKMN